MTQERKIIVHIATSADGYIARPDGSLDWLTSRPPRKGSTACRNSRARWTTVFVNDLARQYLTNQIVQCVVQLLVGAADVSSVACSSPPTH